MSRVRVALIVVCCIAACTAASAATPVNVNGDFESGVLAPWVSSYDPVVTYSVIVDPSNPSNHILQGVPGPDHDSYPQNWWLRAVSQTFAISPNTKYLAMADVKTVGDWGSNTNTQNYAALALVEYSAMGIPWANIYIGGEFTVHDWNRRSVVFTTTSHTVSGYLVYNGQLVSGNQAVYIDNFQVFPIDSSETPFNGNFELGGIDGWTVSGGANAYGVTMVNSHAGTYSCEVTGAAPVSLSNMDQYIDVLPDTDYVATVYYRTEGTDWFGDTAHNIVDSSILEYAGSTYSETRHTVGTITQLTPNWTRLVSRFRTNPSTTQIRWINNNNIQVGDKLFLDDFKVGVPEYIAYSSIGKMKNDGDGTLATFDGTVTGAMDSQYFFVESADRSAGILVESADFPLDYTPSPGTVLQLKGHVAVSSMAGHSGMLVFVTEEQPTLGTPVTPLGALGTKIGAVASDPTLDGLYVKMWGTVSNSNPGIGTFNINDGATTIGVENCLDPTFPSDGDYVAVTGNIIKNGVGRGMYLSTYGSVQIINSVTP